MTKNIKKKTYRGHVTLENIKRTRDVTRSKRDASFCRLQDGDIDCSDRQRLCDCGGRHDGRTLGREDERRRGQGQGDLAAPRHDLFGRARRVHLFVMTVAATDVLTAPQATLSSSQSSSSATSPSTRSATPTRSVLLLQLPGFAARSRTLFGRGTRTRLISSLRATTPRRTSPVSTGSTISAPSRRSPLLRTAMAPTLFSVYWTSRYSPHGRHSDSLTCAFSGVRYHNPDASLQEGLAVLKRCVQELAKRLVVSPDRYKVKVVDKDGVREVELL